MRVRKYVIALALATSATLSSTSVARAEKPAPRPSPVRAFAPTLTPPRTGTLLPGVERIFTPPAVLGEAWAIALRTVLDRMKHSIDLANEGGLTRPKPPVLVLGTPVQGVRAPIQLVRVSVALPPSVAAWQARWSSVAAVHDALASTPVELGPVEGMPPLEVGRDTHGDHLVLLGARLELPWMVP